MSLELNCANTVFDGKFKNLPPEEKSYKSYGRIDPENIREELNKNQGVDIALEGEWKAPNKINEKNEENVLS